MSATSFPFPLLAARPREDGRLRSATTLPSSIAYIRWASARYSRPESIVAFTRPTSPRQNAVWPRRSISDICVARSGASDERGDGAGLAGSDASCKEREEREPDLCSAGMHLKPFRRQRSHGLKGGTTLATHRRWAVHQGRHCKAHKSDLRKAATTYLKSRHRSRRI